MIFAYPAEDQIGRSLMGEQSRGASGGASFETTYADNVGLLGFIVRVRFRIPPADAEALIQDVFFKFARDHAKVREPRKWLTAAASNASLNYWRDRAKEAPLPEDIERWEDPTTSGAADAILTRLAVGTALCQLGDRCREVLHRFHVEGETTQQIADSLGTTAGYVQLRLHLCRKRARELYATLTRVRA
ncbi:MAG TPA: sigma-70 family RNA polymerase sigma factor [Thermoanaerobaculia bacterium]|nr:sigma-70 family RNA polymerase sigma factor [Thermoanaerobaculia bacterium]